MDKEKLEVLSKKLMFKMNDEEYKTLSFEFEVILKEMDLIGKIKDIDKVDPMFYPFELSNVIMREDEVREELDIDQVLLNSSDTLYNQVKLPKVVE